MEKSGAERGGRGRVEGGEGLPLLAVTAVSERLLCSVLSRCLPRVALCVAGWDIGSPGSRTRTRDTQRSWGWGLVHAERLHEDYRFPLRTV